jgi:hypothetical protein
MRKPLRLITLSACIWPPFSCLLLVKAAGPCFPLDEKIFTFYATFFLIIDQSYAALVLVRHQQQANQILVIEFWLQK